MHPKGHNYWCLVRPYSCSWKYGLHQTSFHRQHVQGSLRWCSDSFPEHTQLSRLFAARQLLFSQHRDGCLLTSGSPSDKRMSIRDWFSRPIQRDARVCDRLGWQCISKEDTRKDFTVIIFQTEMLQCNQPFLWWLQHLYVNFTYAHLFTRNCTPEVEPGNEFQVPPLLFENYYSGCRHFA